MPHRPVTITIAHAGGWDAVLREAIIPTFTAETGIGVERVSGHSVALARSIAAGTLTPDLFLSADAEVNRLLMHAGGQVDWFLPVAGNRMVIAYSPRGRFRVLFEDAAAGRQPWYDVLMSPGLAWRRVDPRDDPSGYRTVILARLAERHYGLPGLADRLLGGDENEAQYLSGGFSQLLDGEIDAICTYRTGALMAGLPFITLPAEIDLSDPMLAPLYAEASYTSSRGERFRGTPIAFSAAILRTSRQPEAAHRFAAHLLAPLSQAALGCGEFLPILPLIGGASHVAPAAVHAAAAALYRTRRSAMPADTTAAQMSMDANKAVVRRIHGEFETEGVLAVADAVFAPELRSSERPGRPPGPAGAKAHLTMLRGAFPDLSVEIVHLLAEDDLVAAQLLMRGTHRGPFRGLAPTGRAVTWRGIVVRRLRDGQVIEQWSQFDTGALLRQLEAGPTG